MLGTQALGTKDVAATIAVKDLGTAKSFYEDKLGLKLVHAEGSEALMYQTGDSKLLVYRSQFAGTNRATAATWSVGGDVDEVVQALRAKGVSFEHYDMPGMKREGDVHVAGKMKAAWFKDPDGNILGLTGD
jgi:catechol 2,3-dioxygenase-like lactoylglutathione lyase family enzyme